MVITTPRDVTNPQRNGRSAVVCAVTLLMGGALLSSSTGAQAQAWRLLPAVKATAVASSNVALDGNPQSDVVVTVTPQLQLQGSGANYRLTGTVAADMVQYMAGTRGSRILPRGLVTLNTRLVDRFLFMDAELGADTTSTLPFDMLADGATFYNVATTTRERISPYIDHQLSPQSRITARSDFVWNQGDATAFQQANQSNQADALVQTHSARYDLRPEPAGLRAEFNHQNTRYKNGDSSGLTLETVRLSALYAPDPNLTLGVTAGRDAAQFGSSDITQVLRGVTMRWAPSERTNFDLLAEKRFFGNGWNLNFTHRTPFMALSAGAVRQAATYASLLGTLSANGDVATLVDAMLRTRIMDPVQRQTAVQDLITKRNLPQSLTGPLDLYSRTVQLQQGVNVTMALLGVRHTATLRLFHTRTEDLRGATENTPGLLELASDATQDGGTLTLSRRLTPEVTADLSLTRVNTTGFGPNAGRLARNSVVRLGATYAITPRTTFSGSVRHQTGSSTLVGVNGVESALSVGMLHRF